MSAGEAENGGTVPVRAAHRFDEAALARWMARTIKAYRGPLAVEQFRGGQSNPTYRLATPSRHYVLRRKPPGQLVKGAHAIEREARILEALGRAGFPVPHVHALCIDEGVIGTAFYIMDLVPGRIVWDARFLNVPIAARPDYFDAMNAAIARLHSLDPARIGLADYGRPGNYFARQIRRWTAQYLGDTDAGRDANMDRLIEWLPAHVPPDARAAIVHGDYRCDNMIFHPGEPRVAAVLDWELSTLGDPLADFANHAMMYRMPPHIVAGLAGADLAALNIPTEAEYIAAYCRRTGRDAIAGYEYYLAFNFFRLAAIFHGIKGRAIRGTASSPQALDRARAFPELAALAWAQTSAAKV